MLEELFGLIDAGDLGAVRSALDKDSSLLNRQEGEGSKSALYVAIKSGQEGIAQFLISQKGIDLSLRFNCTVIGNNSDGSILYRVGETILIYAASCGMINTVACLIEKKPGRVKQAAADTGATPLYMASQNSHLEVVKLLLENGADVNQARIDTGATSLWAASLNGRFEVAMLLLDRGADVNQARTADGATPLFMASQQGLVEVAELLLDRGADVNQARTDGGVTPLWIASQQGHADVAELLLERGAEVDRAAQNGAAPLLLASHKGHLEVAKLLVIVGADASDALTKLNLNADLRKSLSNVVDQVSGLGSVDAVVAKFDAEKSKGDVFMAMTLATLVEYKNRSEKPGVPNRLYNGEISPLSFWQCFLGRVAVKIGVNPLAPTDCFLKLARNELSVILLIAERLSRKDETCLPPEMWWMIMGFCLKGDVLESLVKHDVFKGIFKEIVGALPASIFRATQGGAEGSSDEAGARLAEGEEEALPASPGGGK